MRDEEKQAAKVGHFTPVPTAPSGSRKLADAASGGAPPPASSALSAPDMANAGPDAAIRLETSAARNTPRKAESSIT